MKAFGLGVLPNGETVEDYMLYTFGCGISIIPNWNMINTQYIFDNASIEYSKFGCE